MGDVRDLAAFALSTSFTKFCLPEKAEGFDEIKYEWAKTGSKCKDHLTQWVLERKLTERMEDLQPSEWFDGKWKQWQTVFQAWLTKLTDYKALVAQKAGEKAARAAAKEAKTKAKAEKEAREAAAKAKAATEGA